jgi:hypothetical protein
MLTGGFLEATVLLGLLAVLVGCVLALRDVSRRSDDVFAVGGRRSRSFYVGILVLGIVVPVVGVFSLIRYRMDLGRSPRPAPPASPPTR